MLRASLNRDCELLVQMVLGGLEDTELYREIAGTYGSDAGERQSALRRGVRFESSLYADNALSLRRVLCQPTERDPSSISVLDFRTLRATASESKQEVQLRVLRSLMRDLAAGNAVPDLLIQPSLGITIAPDDVRMVYADFMFLDRTARIYIPGEIKSFISRDSSGPKMSLVRVRRQAAVYVAALMEEAGRVSIDSRVSATALLIFATPYGMRPTQAYRDLLEAEVADVLLMLEVLRKARTAQIEGRPERTLGAARELYYQGRINLTDDCMTICALYPLCKRRISPSTRILGDDVASVLGEDITLTRLAALMQGAPAQTDFEIAFAQAASQLSTLLSLPSNVLQTAPGNTDDRLG